MVSESEEHNRVASENCNEDIFKSIKQLSECSD